MTPDDVRRLARHARDGLLMNDPEFLLSQVLAEVADAWEADRRRTGAGALRDQFAGRFAATLATFYPLYAEAEEWAKQNGGHVLSEHQRVISRRAYQLADALLTERDLTIAHERKQEGG